MSAVPNDVVSRIAAWAEARPDITALVQIGSRVQAGAGADAWSDFDFHLITRRPDAYRDPSVLRELGDCWMASAQPVFGGATKATVILAGAVEADFVVLANWELRAAFAALRFPGLAALWPPLLRAGVRDLKIVACPGWRVVKGGPAWERRYARLGPDTPWPPLNQTQFREICAAYWTTLVWVTKKIERGELRAAQREFHRTLLEKTWLLLEQEARDARARARPEARHAEQWLPPARVGQTAITTGPDPAVLRRAVAQLTGLSEEVAKGVAAARGWEPPDGSAIKAWMLAQHR